MKTGIRIRFIMRKSLFDAFFISVIRLECNETTGRSLHLGFHSKKPSFANHSEKHYAANSGSY